MLKTFKYKLAPNKMQSQALGNTLDVCRDLYNMALQQRRDAYQSVNRLGQNASKFAQMRQLTELKQAFPEYKAVHVHVLQNVLKQLNRSFENFFRRCKEGGKPGYPRFKSKHRYESFQFNNIGFNLSGKQLSISKIGNVKVRLSRHLPEDAIIKTCTIKRTVSGWFATLTFEHTPLPLPKSDLAVGVDVGIENYAALSNGSFIKNPRFYEAAQPELRRAQRRVSRRKNGSHRRRKSVVLLGKVHQKIANRRLDYLAGP